MRKPVVYMMANKKNGTIYTGVTSNIIERVYAHKTNKFKGFTSRYDCKILVYLEHYPRMQDAIAREKQLKAGSRKNKLALIESMNPEWQDLYEGL
jgi:predicted GIY-YIG superfamily endonuclease